MKYDIEEVIVTATDQVEIHARLEDGRLACVAAPKGDKNSYADAVAAYLAAAFPPEPATDETSEG